MKKINQTESVLIWVGLHCSGFNRKIVREGGSYLVASAFMVYKWLPYSMLSSPPKRPTLSQIREGTRQRWFLFFKFSKILQLFLSKEQLEGCFIITASYLKRKIKKRRSCSQ